MLPAFLFAVWPGAQARPCVPSTLIEEAAVVLEGRVGAVVAGEQSVEANISVTRSHRGSADGP